MLIQKCGYIPSGTAAGYMQYIATREGVELRCGYEPASKKQTELIHQVLRDFPNSQNLMEYQDYQTAPTAANAAAFLSMALDSNAEKIECRSGYMRYIAQRPGAERKGAHGLFGQQNTVKLDEAVRELEAHQGPVWTVIWSLRREDAVRLGYEHADAWHTLLLAKQTELAKAFGIPPQQLKWYAAFHDAGHHPHIHVMIWSTGPVQGFLTHQGVEAIRSQMTNTIFHDEMLQLYQKKDVSYKTLVRQARETMSTLTRQMAAGARGSLKMIEQLLTLSHMLADISGKKQYGYLPKTVKCQVDAVVDALQEIPEVAECYAAWNTLRDQLESYYTEKPREHLPLSQQKEFRSIKNAVIREADGLFRLASSDEIEGRNQPLDEEESKEDTSYASGHKTGENEAENSRSYGTRFQQVSEYRSARDVLYDETSLPSQQQAALKAVEKLWHQGYFPAAHLLGKCARDGMGMPVDHKLAALWFRRSAETGNSTSQYALGMLLLSQGYHEDALRYLRQAAHTGSSYAQYRMGLIYLDGSILPKDVIQGIRFLKDAAANGNAQAQYALGKLYLLGKDIGRDQEEAAYWLRLSAEQGNTYAKFCLEHLNDHPMVLLAVFRVLYHLERTFQDTVVPSGGGHSLHIDRKRRRELSQRRMATGHKRGY